MATETRKLAERLFDAETSEFKFPFGPFTRRPRLSDLWECDQEKYERMAQAALRGRKS